MKTFAATVALLALAACGSEPAEPAPEQAVATPAPEPTPSLPPPDEPLFAAAFAEACPSAREVSTSFCKAEGFGKPGFVCEFGFDDSERRPHTAILMPGDGKWIIADPEKTCAVDDAA